MVHPLSAEHFEALLQRLGPDREVAGTRYEQLRRRLVAIFTYRRCAQPEDLADETMDRVARKLREIAPGPGATDLSPFVFGVAWNIAKESFKRQRTVPLPERWDMANDGGTPDQEDAQERQQDCLEQCLRDESSVDRELVLTYYEEEKAAKIRRRAMLARQLKISVNAQRLRVHRIVLRLRACVVACIEAGTPRRARLSQ